MITSGTLRFKGEHREDKIWPGNNRCREGRHGFDRAIGTKVVLLEADCEVRLGKPFGSTSHRGPAGFYAPLCVVDSIILI